MRGDLAFPLPIFNAKSPQTIGRVHDVSEKESWLAVQLP